MYWDCVTTADCAEITTGCCLTSMVDSIAEDSIWGDMPEKFVGEQPAKCANLEW